MLSTPSWVREWAVAIRAGALAGVLLVAGCGGNEADSASPSDMLADEVVAKYVHRDGITIPSDDASMPGDDVGSGARGFTFSLQGEGIRAVLDTEGEIRFADGGRLGRGTSKFVATRIQTSKDQAWHAVTKMSINKGKFLVITDQTGASYQVKFKGMSGEITPLTPASRG